MAVIKACGCVFAVGDASKLYKECDFHAARDLAIRATVVEEAVRVVANCKSPQDDDDSVQSENFNNGHRVACSQIYNVIRALKEPPAPSGEVG